MQIVTFRLPRAIFFLFLLCSSIVSSDDNINGVYKVEKGHHYSNKTSLIWGQNGEEKFEVTISLPYSAAVYNCSDSCADPIWMFDWNKLWGKARCGYYHDHHQDSDRFVFRRCSDPSCARYDPTDSIKIELGAYSYDGGIAPYTGENPELMKSFKTTLTPEYTYTLVLSMSSSGLSTFTLLDSKRQKVEEVTIQHTNLCESNYFEGTVQGLYFGGTCEAPLDIVVSYYS